MGVDADMLGLLSSDGQGRAAAPQGPDPDMLKLLTPEAQTQPVEVRPESIATPSEWGLGSSLAQGLTLGAYAPALAYARHLLYGTPYATERTHQDIEQQKYAQENPIKALGGELVGSLPTTLGAMALGQEYAAVPLGAKLAALAPRAAQYVAEGSGALPWALRAGGRLLGYGAQGAASGELQAGLTGQSPEEAAREGATVGAIAGPVGAALAKPLQSAISPTVSAVAQKFKSLGVPIYTNQIPGAPLATKYLSAQPNEQQLGAFTRALSHTFGEDAERITPELLHGSAGAPGAFDRIGAALENAARGSTIPGNDPQLIGSLRSTLSRAANEFGTDSPEYGRVARLVQGVADAAQSGDIKGASYLDLTQKGSAIKNAMSRSSPVRQYAIEFKDALDDALQRNNPAQAQEIGRARHQWHNALIAEQNVMHPGNPNAVEGLANPKTLLGTVKSSGHYGSASRASEKAQAAGQSGDIGVLGVGGRAFLSSGPSGAAHYIATHPTPAALGLLAAGEGAHAFQEPLMHYLTQAHPYAAAGALGLGAGYAGLGALLNRPGYAGALLRGAVPSLPNAMVPAATAAYGLKMTPDGYPYFGAGGQQQ